MVNGINIKKIQFASEYLETSQILRKGFPYLRPYNKVGLVYRPNFDQIYTQLMFFYA